jgi:GNAT superfamily N-acetyltransferase
VLSGLKEIRINYRKGCNMESSLELLKKFWLDELGCTPESFISEKTSVHTHGSLDGYSGVIVFKHRNSCIVSAPKALVAKLGQELTGKSCGYTFNTQILEDLFGVLVDRIIGPAWIGQISLKNFKPVHGSETRELLSESDWETFALFLAECSPSDVGVSSLALKRSPTVGAFAQGRIVAASSYEIRENILAHIGILTHPDARGLGFAKKAISKMTEIALQSGLGIQYQTLISNASSVGAARHLGYTDFAETIAIRLKA